MGWHAGIWVAGVPCEDAPCCGCCGPGSDDPEYHDDDYDDYNDYNDDLERAEDD